MRKRTLLLLILCLCLLAGCSGKTKTAGWLLRAENGAVLFITESREPWTVSDRSKAGNLFDGLDSGDKVEITHGEIAESYPGQTRAYSCRLLEDGTIADIPEEPMRSLEEMGWNFGRHNHTPAAVAQTVEAPVSGYCGNMITKVIVDGATYEFWGSDSVTLTDILINLDYSEEICGCVGEYTVDTEPGGSYTVDLNRFFARCAEGQASLTEQQTESIRGVIERNCTADTWNCALPEE